MSLYADILLKLEHEGNLRAIPNGRTTYSGLIDMSSNDYLGLAARPELQEEFFDRVGSRSIPLTSSASRLLAARQEEYALLEEYLERLYGRKTLLFNSGYHANTGITSALASMPGTFIAADRLVHASIIDGITLSKAPFTRFRHNDLSHLERILENESANYGCVLVITESVFSMDGDRADIDSLVEIKREYGNVMLYVDEAHAVGVEGKQGLGLCKNSNVYDDVDIVVGTFGKACASMGAFCAVSDELHDFLVNRSRSLIFSTALPPMSAAWTRFLLEKIVNMDDERRHLVMLGQQLHDILTPLSQGFEITPSHIQPYVTGNPIVAVRLSQLLLDEGFKVLPIRVPTVPPGTDRLRISLNAALSEHDIERFGESLRKCIAKL